MNSNIGTKMLYILHVVCNWVLKQIVNCTKVWKKVFLILNILARQCFRYYLDSFTYMNWLWTRVLGLTASLLAGQNRYTVLRSRATRKPSQKTVISCDFPFTGWRGAMPDSTSNSPRDASTRGKPDHLDEGHSALLQD